MALMTAPLLLAGQDARSGGMQPAHVTSERMRAPDAPASAGSWMAYGRSYDEQRYSPLTQINDKTVQRLGLAWYDDLNTYRGVQATPLVVDGVIYNASAFNIVTAYDGRTGRKLWTYDPQVERQWARLACCGPSTRGIAAWNGKIYIAALDGRLIAVDARTGKEVWTVQTFDRAHPYSITGAPRVFDGKVVIGHGGADYGVRGFVSAWDAETGKRLWKFYTVPGNPADGPDGEASDAAMKIALPTWHGKWWQYGGGGTAWDSFVYDPALNLVYIGTGNGSPISWHFRSAGKGDNLFLCSIVAVDADTGAYRWHYQAVPEEDWDFTCTQPMMLADLKIKGKTRPVIMQAPKNGFFYVLDRKTGELLSAEKFVPSNWASHIDMKTGRPVLYPGVHLTTTPQRITPSLLAAHSWHPMSFSPKTGLVYFPAMEQSIVYARQRDEDFAFVPFRNNAGFDYAGATPEWAAQRKALQAEADAMEKGYLLAWNPVTQKEAWRVPYSLPGSGGTLATAGNLVFQGTIEKTFAAYRADTGQKLWDMNVDNVAIGGPVTYAIDGVQYVAVNVGWGGSIVAGLSKIPGGFRVSPARLLVFRLDAKGVTLPPLPPPTALPRPPFLRATEAQVRLGAQLYGDTCARCHGENARGGLKDLRYMTPDTRAQFLDIVLEGTKADLGMASFKGVLDKTQAEAIHAYLIARGNEDWQDDAVRQ
ncbi:MULTISPECIES: PQQ-dependent dehydrogenase, methanol/ethanol family [unclassified Sphingobium]|uniref:PQQ-dependent dehydrogenase, methanol/ethanol family n=1 Tax=unclassified Sphingobium TaxID=2611147 RepID=UPI00222429E3|nr:MULTISPECIES: PQQ-dependent dehydrogenase, methanol/ethanol family [unclassified Sphingobium]MCW2394721.1 quinohemoprotein ethanol dehydrogenase [Sphingobium sp. B8D3B]MCW2418235.1 quinohemoprotein ethanol dehydrogenase [Sphingobium sp. B8D3C]